MQIEYKVIFIAYYETQKNKYAKFYDNETKALMYLSTLFKKSVEPVRTCYVEQLVCINHKTSEMHRKYYYNIDEIKLALNKIIGRSSEVKTNAKQTIST